MKRISWFTLVFFTALLFVPVNFADAKGSSFGGGGRGSSSGFSGRSYGGGSSFSGRSSSFGGGSSRSSGGSSRSSYSSPKPSSSGSSFRSSSSKPSSGGSSWFSKPTTRSGSGKSYAPGSKSSLTNKSSSDTTWNKTITQSAQKEQSRMNYERSHPKPIASTYKTPQGSTKQVTPRERENIEHIRETVPPSRYATYDNRAGTFYGGYPYQPYHDSFSPFLMGWLFSSAMNSQDRAMWAYNHQDSMDKARYDELLRRDTQLSAEIAALKAKNTPVDPNYVPPAMAENSDLMYNKEFVSTAVGGGLGWFFWVCFWAVCILSLGGLVWVGIYFLFLKDY